MVGGTRKVAALYKKFTSAASGSRRSRGAAPVEGTVAAEVEGGGRG